MGCKTPIYFDLWMLKSIATASSKCTTKHQNKVNYNTDYIVPDMIGFFDDD